MRLQPLQQTQHFAGRPGAQARLLSTSQPEPGLSPGKLRPDGGSPRAGGRVGSGVPSRALAAALPSPRAAAPLDRLLPQLGMARPTQIRLRKAMTSQRGILACNRIPGGAY